MRKMLDALLMLFCFFPIGCASLVNSVTQAPVQVNGVGPITTVSLAANRRTLIVRTDVSQADQLGKFCAEPPPEVSTDIASNLKAAAEASASDKQSVNLALDDAFKATTVVLAQRTVLLDIYRTGTYALCQYHLNGALDGPQLQEQFKELTNRVMNAFAGTRTATDSPTLTKRDPLAVDAPPPSSP